MVKSETIILAALLHDIGKVYRYDESVKIDGNEFKNFKTKHEAYTALFIDNFSEYMHFNAEKTNIHNSETIRNLASNHHNPQTPLQAIIQQSDRMANGWPEVNTEITEKSEEKIGLMNSIFEQLDLSDEKREKNYIYNYQPLKLTTEIKDIFLNGNDKVDESLLSTNIIKPFLRDFKKLPKINFEVYLNNLIGLMEKYFWCIPASIKNDAVNESLFDHSRLVTALASVLYDFHSQKNSMKKEEIENADIPKFLMVGGDLSGIQNYLFDLRRANIRGLSKILRARSFYITEVCRMSAQLILRKLDLPLCCNILESGGRFLLIVPNTDKTLKDLEELTAKIQKRMMDQFAGELSLSLCWDVAVKPSDFSINVFPQKMSALNESLESCKKQKFQSTLKNNNGWQTNSFQIDVGNVYKGHYEKGTCECCGKFPAIEEIPGDEDETESTSPIYCKTCAAMREMGKILVRTNQFLYSDRSIGKNSYQIMDDCYITLIEKEKEDFNSAYLIENIYDSKKDRKMFKTRYEANYVPRFKGDERDTLCIKCKDNNDCKIKESIKQGDIKTFECLTASGMIKEDDKIKGSSLLGILRADVDRMGYLLGFGLNKFSLVHYAGLSRQVQLFFTGYLQEMLKEKESPIYTVYAGGDDLFLIGEWKQIIQFSKEMNKAFREYTCSNKDIHLSAGIVFVKPRYPIGQASVWSEEELETSKKMRNQITLFNTTVEWDDLNVLLDYANMLDENLRNKNLNKAFLHRLLKYHQMYLRVVNNNEIENLICFSHLSYDIRRNIVREDRGQILNYELIIELNKLYTKDYYDETLFKNIKIPIYWTLFKNRK